MDGHGSHLTPAFNQFCIENSTSSLYMLPHSSHLLQPIDISCFAILKRLYSLQIEQSIRLGIDHINKEDFLLALIKPVHRLI